MKKILILCLALTAAIQMTAMSQATPKDTIDVVCYDLKLDVNYISLFHMAYIYANNHEYKLTGAIIADSIPPGIYTNCMMDLKHIATNKKIPATSVCIQLDRDEKGYCVITGTMLGEDNILYNLHLSWQAPSVKDTVAISFHRCSEVAYYPDLGHDFMLTNQNDQYNVAIDIIQVPMGEEFTKQNLNMGYCLIANRETNDTIQIAEAKGKVWQSNDTTYLTTMITGFDSILYQIEMWYAVPEVIDQTELIISNTTFYNKMESDGYYALVGCTADKEYEFGIALLGNTEEDIPGTYVNDGLFGGFSGQNYDFLHFIGGQYTTYVAKWNPQQQDYDIISIEKGTATLTMDSDSAIHLNGIFVGANGVAYSVALHTNMDKPRILDDAPAGDVNRMFVDKNELTIEQLTEDKVRIEIMTDSDLLALWVYVEYIDDEIIIPEGEYVVSDAGDYWTVIAGDGSLGKSFYATHDGEMFTSLYFLIDGTLIVSKKNGELQFELNALNSYDVPVHIVYEAASSTGVEHVGAKTTHAKKKLINNHFFIEVDGETYNILGAK